MEENGTEFTLSLSLNILKHLGINLYSNIPAVLSEIVANSYDADASKVWIDIHPGDDNGGPRITITDNGCGMTFDDMNEKFLTVGYDRRVKKGEGKSIKYKRPVMGRKGIGKLSMFSIAEYIEVKSRVGSKITGLVLNLKEIEKHLKDKEKSKLPFHPSRLHLEQLDIPEGGDHGTVIELTHLKKRITGQINHIEKRLARRFTVISGKNNFQIYINGEEIKIDDREYFKKIQYMWCYGIDSVWYRDLCDGNVLKNMENFQRPNVIKADDGNPRLFDGNQCVVTGWIGTIIRPSELSGVDNWNKISIVIRGKVAQEDVMPEIANTGVYQKYLIGEIQADFLDYDNLPDITTSSRQSLMTDTEDDRYQALLDWLRKELSFVKSQWLKGRQKDGGVEALTDAIIKKWYDSLDGEDNKKRAMRYFGKINTSGIEDEKLKRELTKSGIIAFEYYSIQKNLDGFDRLEPEEIPGLIKLFRSADEIEAAFYYQTIANRVKIIRTMIEKVDQNVIEGDLRDYLFDHLEILDPSWEKATDGSKERERAFFTGLPKKIREQLNSDGEGKRFDIRYKTAAGQHIIVELKRPQRDITSSEIYDQIRTYYSTMEDVQKQAYQEVNPDIRIVLVTQKEYSDINGEADRQRFEESLAPYHARVLTYKRMLDDALGRYRDFMGAETQSGRLTDIIRSLELSDEVFELQVEKEEGDVESK